MLNYRFIRRQLTITKKQSFIYVLCIVLSIITLVALRGFGESVNRVLLRDAKELHAADIIVESNFGISEAVAEQIALLEEQGQVESANLYEFYSLVRVEAEDNSLLSGLKVVEAGYPFYGEVEVASGQPFHEVLTSGNIVVDQVLLDRLNIDVGDSLHVGKATLTIRDVVTHEPDRPVNFFSLGPRVFIAEDDLESLDLVKEGSRVEYTTLLKVDGESNINPIAEQLQEVRDEGQEVVETYRTAASGIQRFFDNFLFFLSLVGIFTLILAGIGIQSALTAFLRERHTTIAILKTLGATRRFVTTHFIVIVATLGGIGILIGLGFGFLLERFLPSLLAGFLPPDVELVISSRAVFESILLGIFVVAAFTFLPLYQLEELKPSFIFRKETSKFQRGWPFYVTLAAILVFFTAMVLWQLGRITTGFYFVGGVLGLLLIAAALSEAVLWLLRKRQVKQLEARQALRGLFRPRNATRSIVITLSASLAVIFCIFLIEQTLDSSFVSAYPEDAPNLFFLDIQPDQVEAFSEALAVETEFFPVVNGTIAQVNGETPALREERNQNGERRDLRFRLTYRKDLLDDERIAEGEALFADDFDGIQVSILDEIADFTQIALGDRVTFRIQGVPLEATVTSVRTRTEESVRPFFSFVFPPDVLKDAPQTIFTAITVEGETASIQNQMVAQFPNISAIDVTATIQTFASVARRITQVIRFFTFFSIAAGVLIVISSVLATRFARIQESVYYKVLGAQRRFVLRVFTLENLFLGLVSALLALLMAQVGSWIINTQVFELDYKPFVGASLTMIILTMLLVTGVGMLASVSILSSKPINFLREQTGEE